PTVMRCTLRLHLVEVIAHEIKPVQNVSHFLQRQIIQMISVASRCDGKQQVAFLPECVQVNAQFPQKEDEIFFVTSSLMIGSLPTGDRVLPINVQSVETVRLDNL